MISHKRSDFADETEWQLAKAGAFVVKVGTEEYAAKSDEPYGPVTYADPGLKADKKKRYPIDTEEHIRAAWSYINQEKNHKGYTPEQVAHIKAKIVSAWKSKIDPKGPPSAQ